MGLFSKRRFRGRICCLQHPAQSVQADHRDSLCEDDREAAYRRACLHPFVSYAWRVQRPQQVGQEVWKTMSTILADPAKMMEKGAPRVIRNDRELEAYTDALFELTSKSNPSKAERQAIELLTLLIE